MKSLKTALCILWLLRSVLGQSTRCGSSWEDANSNCGTACPDSNDSQCPSGQQCFTDLDEGPCNGGSSNAGGTSGTSGNQAGDGSQSTSRCGTSWADANSKCGTGCPDGTDASCGSGEKCFQGLDTCDKIKAPQETECSESKECPLKACCSQWGFCGWTLDFCNDKCLANCEIKASPADCDDSLKMSINLGYYASWATTRPCDQVSPKDIDVSLYTHLIFSFAAVSEDHKLIPAQDSDIPLYTEFNDLKSKKSELKTAIAVGGWAFNDPPTQNRFTDMVSTPDNRKVFIESVLDFLRKYKFDGLDIDWEYPGADDRGGKPDDFKNYPDLLDELRSAFDAAPERFGLTIAVPLSYWYLRHFDLERMYKAVDHMNVMSYDIHGIWDANIPSLGPYVKSHTNITEIEESFNMFFKNGVPPSKLALGAASYGRTYTLQDPNCHDPNCTFTGPGKPGKCTQDPGILSYAEIQRFLEDNPDAQKVFDAPSASNYIYYGDQWISYDDPGAFAYKIDLATKYCLKGIMTWSVDMVTQDISIVMHSLMAENLQEHRRFDNMSYMCTHNSFTNYQDARWASVSQSMSIADQLKNGVRGLMLDTHYEKPGALDIFKVIPKTGVYLLHAVNESGWIAGSTYALPSQRLSDALKTVVNFLKDNPNEIVTIFLEDYTETDQLKEEMDLVEDLQTYLYDPDNSDKWKVPDEKKWPTVKDMISWNKRLIILSSKDHKNTDTKIGVPYDWKYTKQNYWSIGGLGNKYECKSRWNDGEYIDDSFPKLFVLNHYRDVPTIITAAIDNSRDNLRKRVDDFCYPTVKQLPNFYAVAFFEVPNNALKEIVGELNEKV